MSKINYFVHIHFNQPVLTYIFGLFAFILMYGTKAINDLQRSVRRVAEKIANAKGTDFRFLCGIGIGNNSMVLTRIF